MTLFSRYKFILFLPILLVQFACSDGGSSGNSLTFSDKPEADAAFRNFRVECEDTNSCSDSVGGLIAYSEKSEFSFVWGYQTMYQISVCNSYLTQPDEIITNRHCLPADIAYESGSCDDILIKFPQTKKYSETSVKCTNIQKLSAEYNPNEPQSPDWAILKLASPVNRPIAKIDLNGLEDNTDFIMYPIFYTKIETYSNGEELKYFAGSMKKVTCTSSMNDVLNTLYNHRFSPLIGGGCSEMLKHGNSGSAMLSAKERLLGVLSFGVDDSSEGVELLGKNHKVESYTFGGSNLACMDYFNPNPSEFCKYSADTNSKKLGSYLKFVYGYTIKPGESEKVDEVIGSDKSIQWGPYNHQMFSEFYSKKILGEMTTDLTGFSFEYFDQLINAKHFPVLPTCIDRVKATGDEFSLFVPRLVELTIDTSIDNKATLTTPMVLRSLKFNVKFNADDQRFEGQLIRMDEHDRQEFVEALQAVDEEFENCSKNEWTGCYYYEKRLQELEEFKNETSIDFHLLNNEEFIFDNSRPENVVLKIPACTAVQDLVN